jgi:hypothetical protein
MLQVYFSYCIHDRAVLTCSELSSADLSTGHQCHLQLLSTVYSDRILVYIVERELTKGPTPQCCSCISSQHAAFDTTSKRRRANMPLPL